MLDNQAAEIKNMKSMMKLKYPIKFRTPVGPAPTITKERASLISSLERDGILALSKQ